MLFFLDTNIPLGYTIIHDKWHDISKKFIEDHDDALFWSNLVHNEYYRKLNDIIDEINHFLEASEDILIINQNDFINYDEFRRYVLKRTKKCALDPHKKQKILEHFWGKYEFYEGISEIVSSKFSTFINDFDYLYYKRHNYLSKTIDLHDCGLNNYKRYLAYAKLLNDWGVHNPDCKIVTDAHDFGLEYGDVTFVSTDENLIKRINNHNHRFLNVIEFKCLN